MRALSRNSLRMLALACVLGGSSLLTTACDDDSDAAEEIGEAVDDAADDVEDAVEDAAE